MVAVIVVILGLLTWVGIGAAIMGSSRPSTAASTRAGCEDCAQLDAWWNSMDGWGKLGGALWYGVAKAACLIRGC